MAKNAAAESERLRYASASADLIEGMGPARNNRFLFEPSLVQDVRARVDSLKMKETVLISPGNGESRSVVHEIYEGSDSASGSFPTVPLHEDRCDSSIWVDQVALCDHAVNLLQEILPGALCTVWIRNAPNHGLGTSSTNVAHAEGDDINDSRTAETSTAFVAPASVIDTEETVA
jgi:hypothetical protein